MTPDEVRRARKALGLSQSKFAELLGVHLVTVKKWETGAQGLRTTSERLIRVLIAQRATARPKSRRGRRGGRGSGEASQAVDRGSVSREPRHVGGRLSRSPRQAPPPALPDGGPGT